MKKCPFKKKRTRIVNIEKDGNEYNYCRIMRPFDDECIGEDKCPIIKRGKK